jgi:hypothetical protein
MDTSNVELVTGAAKGTLERDYGDQEGYEIGAVILIVEVQGPEGGNFRVVPNIQDPHATLGVLRIAEDTWLRSLRGDA